MYILCVCLLDLFRIKEEVLPLAGRWKSFGLALGLSSDDLSRIKGNNKSVESCLEETLDQWLKSVVTLRGPPSWQLLVDAVASPAGGKNEVLARQIAKKYNITNA